MTVEPAISGAARTVRFRVGTATHVLVSGVDRNAAAALAKSAAAKGLLDLCAGQYVMPATGLSEAMPGLWVLTHVSN